MYLSHLLLFILLLLLLLPCLPPFRLILPSFLFQLPLLYSEE